MSLINEALKKAQGQRPQDTSQAAHGSGNEPPQPPQPPEKKRRHSFLWGFILAVIVVGTFSILLTTFFVYQLLPQDEKEEPAISAKANPAETTPQENEEASETIPGMESVETKPKDSGNNTTQVTDGAQSGKNAETKPAGTAPSDPGPVASSSTSQSKPPADESASLPQPPNPAVISRLLELEIRGTLGGSKVLILDQATGKTRAYRAGDSLEGSMGLIVEDISPSSIKLKDYAGYIHTKSF